MTSIHEEGRPVQGNGRSSVPILAPSYREPAHEDLAHVLNFSGGRSSAYMLFGMLAHGQLRRERGDVVVFCNTSAEHPATYDFVAECKQRVEAEGIPFFCLQFATYEAGEGRGARRVQTYQLVQAEECQKNGEVFEAMLSHINFLPTRYRRACTRNLKLLPTKQFVADWQGSTRGPGRKGDDRDVTAMTDNQVHARHLAHGGRRSRENYLKRKASVRAAPMTIPAQLWESYSSVPRCNADGLRPGTHSQYVKLLGLRADEPRRIQNLKEKLAVEGAEQLYAPLSDSGISKAQVLQYWEAQDFDLQLPPDAGLTNCVYCFMKGKGALRKLAASDAGRRELAEPCRVGWWIKQEEHMGERESGIDTSFFGVGDWSYRQAQSEADKAAKQICMETECVNCTD